LELVQLSKKLERTIFCHSLYATKLRNATKSSGCVRSLSEETNNNVDVNVNNFAEEILPFGSLSQSIGRVTIYDARLHPVSIRNLLILINHRGGGLSKSKFKNFNPKENA
jgi:hypothetical protein